ncbi:hypothetical protein PInf_009697 [Phytophthora infestans]|nr:hypothetical protein PInf_009697 [Phytophthora infestans]
MEKASPPSSTLALLVALCPCLFYFICSLAMNLLTKTLVTTFQWRFVYTLGAIQSIFTLTSLTLPSTVRFTGIKQQSSGEPAKHKHQRVIYGIRVLLPLMALHLSNMLLGFASLQVVNLPMYLVLRRLTTITVLLIEWLVLDKVRCCPLRFPELQKCTLAVTL